MEQGSLRTPNLASFRRITGHAYFFADGEEGGRNLGNIVMHNLTYSPEKVELDIAVDGDTVQISGETSRVKPVFDIKGNQFHSAILDLILLGSRKTDETQVAAVAATMSFKVHAGKSYDLQSIGVKNLVVKKASTVLTEGVHYYAEANKGMIRVPELLVTPATEGTFIVATYDKIDLVREVYSALDQLNRTGMMKLFQMSNKSTLPIAVWQIPGTLSGDSFGESDPKKYSEWDIKFSVGTGSIDYKGLKAGTSTLTGTSGEGTEP